MGVVSTGFDDSKIVEALLEAGRIGAAGVDENRDVVRWTRAMFWVVLATFAVSAASLAVSLVVLLRS